MIETVAEAPQTPAGVIAALRHEHDTAQLAEARKLALAVDWAALHPAESIDAAAGWPVPGAERDRALAGPGTPSVAEFCVADLAAAPGMSTDAGRSFLGAALELGHRLPRLYARVMSGDLPAWRARRVAERTSHLPTAGAAWVERHLAPVAHQVGIATIERLIEAALAEFDPETAEITAHVAADGRRLDIDLTQPSFTGTVEIHGCLDLADGLDHALRVGAATQKNLGSTLSLDQRRAPRRPGPHPTRPRPHRHHTHTRTLRSSTGTRTRSTRTRGGGGGGASTGVGTGRAAVEDPQGRPPRPPHPRRPDRRQPARHRRPPPHRRDPHPHRAGPHLVRRSRHRDRPARRRPRRRDHRRHLRHPRPPRPPGQDPRPPLRPSDQQGPWCTRPASGCDLDHVIAYTDGGPTTSCNLAPLCRFHHRLKTHGRWRYHVLHHRGPGHYQWTDPHANTYTVDTGPRGGTIRGPDPPLRT